MRRRRGLVPIILLLACSNLTEGEGGVVALEIVAPEPPVVAVGQTIQLSARPLDRDGEPVEAEVTWRTPDATVTVDSATGLLTGVSAGTGRVQALSGSLTATVTFTVVESASGRALRHAR